MAYNREEIIQLAKDSIEKHKLFFIDDIVTYLPCSRSTFYSYFELDSDELDVIKELLNKNRVEIKVSMRNKWYKSDNPTLQIALMRIISNDEEFNRLVGTRTDVTTNGKDIGQLDLSKFTYEQLIKLSGEDTITGE